MTQLAIRVDDNLLAFADRVAKLAGKQSVTGSIPNRSEVMREALRRGLAEMERELTKKKAK